MRYIKTDFVFLVIGIILVFACSLTKPITGVVTCKYKAKGKHHITIKSNGKITDHVVSEAEYNNAKLNQTITVR